ncbi:NAD-dependent epimerase/dehydratase family protein [Isoptericola sp. NEAU-Y5]|uniref:NAD-dependent epimerase/dehydratase family protein n=1 Tax=Isoptericola luteus TaxID=2879484 RepID=A0ABS7ZFD1_9MICO|nr:NAD-dependent epimerase/dehydratase family protein [Isoptericola sp. NEAU-Y5]MCA5893730.1 NAD-dependent epimerase/dehydratase family protein [Isoptericola sp. NEAU-Y5]
MRVLVLGGSVFLSRAVAADALARGHEVVALTRGRTGGVPDGVRHVVADREGPFPGDLAAEAWDAVVDVSRTPSHVRKAVAAVPGAHWVFVSTINVYADDTDPGGPGVGRLREPEHQDLDPSTGPEAYGAMKVACEQTVLAAVASATVVRPGLVVGPGDPSGRFAYWPQRMRRVLDGGAADVLAPGDPDDVLHVVDVRDLAAWIVDVAERRTEGTFDGVGPRTTVGELLDAVARGTGAAAPRWRWAGRAELEAADVRPWSGERSLPLWLPRPEYDGMAAHDAGPALAAGLSPRPVEDTARDTLAWLRATPDAAVTGLTAEQESGVLRGVAGPPPTPGG